LLGEVLYRSHRLLPETIIVIVAARWLAGRWLHHTFLSNRRNEFRAFPIDMIPVAAHRARLCILHYDSGGEKGLLSLSSLSQLPPVSITATPPSVGSILKDLLDCRAHGLEERPRCKSLVEGSTAIDRGSHVHFAESSVPKVGCSLIGVEICEDRGLGREGHDCGTVGGAARSQEMDTSVPAGYFGKVIEGQGGASEEESCREDTEDCEKNLGSEHGVLSYSLFFIARRFYSFNFLEVGQQKVKAPDCAWAPSGSCQHDNARYKPRTC
jgi:hypothetical protein